MSEMALYKPKDLRQTLMVSSIVCCVAAAGLIWLFNPWFAVFVVVLGAVLVMAWMPLRTVVMVFIFLSPFDLQRRIGGHWIYLDLLVAIVALPLFRIRKWPPRLCWLLVPFFLYFVFTGVPRSQLPVWVWGYAIHWSIALCFCAAVAMSGAAEELAIVAGVTLIPLTIYGLYQLLLGDFGSVFAWMNPEMVDQPWLDRSYSLLWHPNVFGDFAGMVTAMMLALGAKGHRPRLSFSLAVLGIVGVLCSGSRGAEIGVGITILVILTQTPAYWRKFAVISVAILIVWGAQHFEVIPLQRAQELDEFTIETRMLVWGEAYVAWQQHRWIGLGATNFSSLMGNFGPLETSHAHNTYLQILAETGLIGFALFYGPLVYFLWRAWRARLIPIAFAGACALVFWFVQGLVDYDLTESPPSLLLLLTVIGLIISGLRLQKTLHPHES